MFARQKARHMNQPETYNKAIIPNPSFMADELNT